MDNINLGNQGKKSGNFWIIFIVAIFVMVIIFVVWYMRANRLQSDESAFQPAENHDYDWSQMDKGPYYDRISYATSTNLKTWKDSGEILEEHASVPDVILKNGTIYAYFVDFSVDGIKEQIGMIKSENNGKTWSEKQIVTIEGLESKTAVDPDPYLLDDGRIRLYYFDISTTKEDRDLSDNAIYSAISEDGVNFTEEEGKRFAYRGIFDPDVIKIGDSYRMFCGTDQEQVIYADSEDGLSFNYQGVALEKGSIPNVIYESGTYYMFTGGIEISTSKDGKNFAKTSNKFEADGLTADPGVVKLGENNFFMIYKTNNNLIKKAN